MAEVYDCSDSSRLLAGTRRARQSIGRGELVVLPTDTVYGLAADAFSAVAVQRLLDAKGRDRTSPPPVLIAGTATLHALAAEVPEAVTRLAEAFWPGALTIVLASNPSLDWDLGETGGTVALRVPDSELTLELLQETGPLAVSSANRSGEPAAQTIADAQRMLGDDVAVYLDDGDSPSRGVASTIVDATRIAEGDGTVRILREGGVSRDALAELLPGVAIEGAVTEEEPVAERSSAVIEEEPIEPTEDGSGG